MWYKFLSTSRLKAIGHYLHNKILRFLIFLAQRAVQALVLCIKMPNNLARFMPGSGDPSQL